MRAFELITAFGGHVSQVKENFGPLCGYARRDGKPNEGEIRAVLAAPIEIEIESLRTCERCGAPG